MIITINVSAMHETQFTAPYQNGTDINAAGIAVVQTPDSQYLTCSKAVVSSAASQAIARPLFQ